MKPTTLAIALLAAPAPPLAQQGPARTLLRDRVEDLRDRAEDRRDGRRRG